MNSPTWKRKRALQKKMEKARSCKRRKVIDDVSKMQNSSSETTGSQDDAAPLHQSSDSNDVRLNVQDYSDAEDTDIEFDPQESYEEYLSTVPRETLKVLAVMMTDCFMTRFGLTTVAAAKESGMLFDVNEKTVRNWRNEFYNNNGSFHESKRGKHIRPFVLDDEECRSKAAQWVRSNASVKGKPNMTALKFCNWVNTDLLPHTDLPPILSQSIKEGTAVKWLHELGFRSQKHKKGIYIDGHERQDVVEYRRIFLRKIKILESTHLPPPQCSDSLCTSFDVGNMSANKVLVLIYHDESTFHANEGQGTMWVEDGNLPIRPKSQGRGIMVSDFVTEHDGLLQLTMEEYREASKSDPSLKMCAREVIKFGSGGDGYWTNNDLLKQMERAVKIASIKYDSARFNCVWIFDQSSGHCAYKETSLNVSRMNVKPGGQQPKMHDTYYNGKYQKMVLPDGRPKGTKLVLEERGVDTRKMKAEDMRIVLGNHHDFKHEKTALEYFLHEKHQKLIYLPKFHCELNPIERVWGEAKRYTSTL